MCTHHHVNTPYVPDTIVICTCVCWHVTCSCSLKRSFTHTSDRINASQWCSAPMSSGHSHGFIAMHDSYALRQATLILQWPVTAIQRRVPCNHNNHRLKTVSQILSCCILLLITRHLWVKSCHGQILSGSFSIWTSDLPSTLASTFPPTDPWRKDNQIAVSSTGSKFRLTLLNEIAKVNEAWTLAESGACWCAHLQAPLERKQRNSRPGCEKSHASPSPGSCKHTCNNYLKYM